MKMSDHSFLAKFSTSSIHRLDLVYQIIGKEDARILFLIYYTDPADAAPGTIRKAFAASVGENAVHGSDSDENAEKEVAFFFAAGDIPTNL